MAAAPNNAPTAVDKEQVGTLCFVAFQFLPIGQCQAIELFIEILCVPKIGFWGKFWDFMDQMLNGYLELASSVNLGVTKFGHVL